MTAKLVQIHFIHTNDLHSHLDQCPRIAGQMRAIRSEVGADRLLAMDLGDHLDRVNIDTEGTNGKVNIDLLNQSGYDFIVLGNNESLTFSATDLTHLYGEQIQLPVVVANWFHSSNGTRPSWLKPYLIFERSGIRVGVIGLTVNFHDFYSLLGWDLQDPIQILKEMVAEIRDQVDLLVVASHVGLPADRRMATEIAGIDCIFGAHTHHRLDPPEKIGDTWLFGTGKYGQALGHVTLELDPVTKRPVHMQSRLIEIDESIVADESITQLMDTHRATASTIMSEVVAHLPESLVVSVDQESTLPNLLAKVLREKTNAEMAFINSGVCLRDLPQGAVSRADLLFSCPSPINPCVIELSGRAIREALELALDETHVFRTLTGYGFRGKEIGTLAVDGLMIEADRRFPIGQRIVSVRFQGQALEMERQYRVAIEDLFTFGVGYPMLGVGENRHYIVPDMLRDWLLEALHCPDWIEDAKRNRWHFNKNQ